MCKKVETWQDCMDSKKAESFGRHNGVNFRETGGSHVRMEYKGEHETMYRGGMSKGVAKKVFEFFVKAGFVAVLFIAALWVIL